VKDCQPAQLEDGGQYHVEYHTEWTLVRHFDGWTTASAYVPIGAILARGADRKHARLHELVLQDVKEVVGP
jgi:hypothetical protein